MIGLEISHYKITEKLGEGGMGVVYKGIDTNLDRTVALKFLPAHLTISDSEKQRFINEAKAASALDHPNICTVFAIDETKDGSLFIVMAYYDGYDLNHSVEKGPLPLKQVIDVSSQAAAGLQKAHEKGIIHRDLKPGNIFITNENIVKIIDFGLAKAANQGMLTKTGATLGTFPYMSPEQTQGEKVDHRTDIWSLGVVMHEMITGLRPFKSEYESALVYSILNEDPPPVTSLRTGVPMELERIVNKCIEKNPGDRYQSFEELIIDLKRAERELTSGSKSTVSVPSRKENSVPNNPRKKNFTRPLSFSILGLIAIIAVIYLFSTDKPAPTDQLARYIAVLPLENLSPNPDDAYFSAGIHEDIIIQLSRIGDLNVIGRSSVMNYPAGQRNMQQISRDLGVQSILEGSVRRAANMVRVAVSLTDVSTNRTLWAETYDRDLTDIFAIQSEIAFEIARALEAQLTESEQILISDQPTTIPEAYELYLRARDFFNQPGGREENLVLAEALLNRSIEYDPEFAHAYAMLSRINSSYWWFNMSTDRNVVDQSLEFAEKAFSIQPNLAEAHIAMGYYYYHGNRNYTEALKQFDTALQYQPNNADIISAIAFVQRRLGNFEESITNLERAISLDPRNLSLLFNNAQSKMLTKRHQESEADYQIILDFNPQLSVVKILMSLNRILWKADADAVREFFRTSPEVREIQTGDWIRLKFLIGDYEGIIQTVNEVPRDLYEGQLFLYTPNYILGIAHEIAGNREQAHYYFSNALDEYLEMYDRFDQDPRYRASLGRIYASLNMPDEAIENGERAVSMIVEMVDALEAPPYKNELAAIYATLNKPTETVEVLRELLSNPGYMTVPRLNLEPVWNPVRNSPEFRALLREFE